MCILGTEGTKEIIFQMGYQWIITKLKNQEVATQACHLEA